MNRASMLRDLGRRLQLLGFSALAVATPAAFADSYVSGSAEDPVVREAAYFSSEHEYLPALSAFQALLPAEGTPGVALPADIMQQYGSDQLSFGMVASATQTFSRLSGATNSVELQLDLARFSYERADYTAASGLLSSVKSSLTTAQFDDWQNLYGMVLLDQQRYADAISVLQQPSAEDAKYAPFIRYNLAVATILSGNVDAGRDMLNKLGTMQAPDDDMLSLRDKANLVLGFSYLKAGLGDSAIPVLFRIRFTGPFSNSALLGLGWAELSLKAATAGTTTTAATATLPASASSAKQSVTANPNAPPKVDTSIGGMVSRSEEADAKVYERARIEAPKTPSLTPEKEKALRSAMRYWVELQSRDPMDTAVQEASLALPYVLDQLGAEGQAEQMYERAAGTLTSTIESLDVAMTDVKDGKAITALVQRDQSKSSGWKWQLRDLPAGPESFHLQVLFASIPFQEALKRYRDTQALQFMLDQQTVKLQSYATAGAGSQSAALQARIDALKPQISEVSRQQYEIVQQKADDELQKQKNYASRYLVQARIAIARLYDRRLNSGGKR